jgi:hypothetical protein
VRLSGFPDVSSSRRTPANLPVGERVRETVRELYFRTDWQKVAILAVIGSCAFAILVLIIAIREVRM